MLLSALCSLLMAQAYATTWYVNGTTGSNANPCTGNGTSNAQNPSFAKQTIAGGLSCVRGTLGAGAGHVVEVAPGTYTETIDQANNYPNFPSGTSWSAPFTLRGGTGAQPWTVSNPTIWKHTGELNLRIYPASAQNMYVVIQGFIFDGSNQTVLGAGQVIIGYLSRYVRFQNNEVRNTMKSNGMQMQNTSTNHEILNNKFHDGAFACVGGGSTTSDFCYPIYNLSSSAVIDGNEFYNFPGFGLHNFCNVPAGDQPCNNNVVRNNKFHDFASAAAIVMEWGTGNIAYNNVIYNGGAAGAIRSRVDVLTVLLIATRSIT
jgi:Right handed beta helix region